jgi:protein-disulfide isomerase
MRHISWFFIICLSLSLAAQTFPATSSKRAVVDKQKLEAFVRKLELLEPKYKVIIGDPKPSLFPDYDELPVQIVAPRMVAAVRYFISKDGQHLIQGSLLDISKNPFQEQLSKLTTNRQPGFGSSSAPVTIVVFADFQCPVCRHEAKMIRQEIPAKYPNMVRVYFKDFPWENEHKWAKPAAIAGRCIFKQKAAAFWDYHDWVYEHQEDFTAANFNEKALAYSKTAGLDTVQLQQCVAGRTAEAEVNQEVLEAHSLQVNRTPTLFINGRELSGQFQWESLDRIIKYELEGKMNVLGSAPCSVESDGCSVWPPK